MAVHYISLNDNINILLGLKNSHSVKIYTKRYVCNGLTIILLVPRNNVCYVEVSRVGTWVLRVTI